MNFLFETQDTDFRTLFFQFRNFKIKIDVSKTSNKNTQIFIFHNFQWNLLMTEKFHITSSGFGSSSNPDTQIQQKLPELINKISILLN